LPHALLLPLHVASESAEYADSVDTAIMTAGCTASRASVAAAIASALKPESVVPSHVELTQEGSRVQSLADRLVEIRTEIMASL